MSPEPAEPWLNKQTKVSLGLAVSVFVFIGIGIERFSKVVTKVESLSTAVEASTQKLERIDDRLLTRDDVELIVKAQLGSSLLEVYKEVNELKGRVTAIENNGNGIRRATFPTKDD